MAEKDAEKIQVQTGTEPGPEEPSKKPDEKPAKSAPQKGGKKSGKAKSKAFKENMIQDSETAKERGRNGGMKSGEVRRAKRDARDAIQYILSRMTKSATIRSNLKELGVEDTEFTNMIALHGRLFTMAMSGDLDAYLTLMRMGGYEPEEIRKERESLAADRRRELELDAKIEAIGRGDHSELAVNLQNEDGSNDVVIYMPQIDAEEDCEMEPETPVAEDSAK